MKHILLFAGWIFCALAHGADFVVAVSVDGLGSGYMQTLVDAGKLPHFKQLELQSAGTTNARNDYDITVTLPNHTSMLTSRPIKGSAGHGWTSNTDPAKGVTIHSNKGAYIASVFDVAHDHGKRTGLWATKTKFSLFQLSYDAEHGAPDTTATDHGRNKLDVFKYNKASRALTADFVRAMNEQPCQFAFVHFVEADSAGHGSGWGSEAFNAALIELDGCLGQIMDLISTNPALKGRTALIVTADHGGKDKNHAQADAPAIYTIPFFVWGAGAAYGDLYAFNSGARRDPAGTHPAYGEAPPPIRNGEVGNLALHLLGLGPIPGSKLDAQQDLKICRPVPGG